MISDILPALATTKLPRYEFCIVCLHVGPVFSITSGDVWGALFGVAATWAPICFRCGEACCFENSHHDGHHWHLDTGNKWSTARFRLNPIKYDPKAQPDRKQRISVCLSTLGPILSSGHQRNCTLRNVRRCVWCNYLLV